LPDKDFGQNIVIDIHRYICANHLRHPTSGTIRSRGPLSSSPPSRPAQLETMHSQLLRHRPNRTGSMRTFPPDLFESLHLASPVHRPPRPLRRQGRPIYRLRVGPNVMIEVGPVQSSEITDFFATRQPPTEASLVLAIDSSACRAAAKAGPSEARIKE